MTMLHRRLNLKTFSQTARMLSQTINTIVMCVSQEKFAEKVSRGWKRLEDMIRGNQSLGANPIQKFATEIAYRKYSRWCRQALQRHCLLSSASPSSQNFISRRLLVSPRKLWKKVFPPPKSSSRLHKKWWAFDRRAETIFVLKWESTNSINYRNELHLETTIQLPPTQINTFCS